MSRFAKFTWVLLLYNLVVIIWGAVVRATGSGAGCGAHWPTCHGDILPTMHETATLIEFTHRVTSGIVLLLVVMLIVWVWRIFPQDHPVRWGRYSSPSLRLLKRCSARAWCCLNWWPIMTRWRGRS